MSGPLTAYLTEMSRVRSSGVAARERSYYGPLQNLLNELGRQLKPKVFCLSELKDTGAGHPDFGLFTQSQLPKASLKDPVPNAPPERGVIEVKGVEDDLAAIAESGQVRRYLQHYGLVLVTTYREFVLVGRNADGAIVSLERYCLAGSAADFWALAAHPARAGSEAETRFVEFLTRVLLHKAPLAQPKDLAWFLASYARDALARVEAAGDMPALAAVRTALEESLGLKFEGDKGDHFFRSTLVQTLFYGVFSAWVLWSREQKPGSTAPFDWHAAAWSLHVPMVRTLFSAVATPERLGPLGLVEVLDWTTAALNRVDRAAFFSRFEEAQAVQYFYEPFLEAFDPGLRKQLGVWYTPQEIVRYMVERVDRVLRSELGLADGLADPRVYVLDPCCGTGSYLVEVLERIARTLREKGDSALLGHDVKAAAKSRVFGFEIMPAPYVIAHWQVGSLLSTLGAPLSDAEHERAGIYLTNALTGWEPPTGPRKQLALALPELEEEREAAAQVKRETPILVILGNPPYNAFAGTSPDEEGGLVDVYKAGLVKDWGIRKFNLDDLYVRFFRIAERRIAEGTGRGVICYISNFSVIGDPSFVVMRRRLLDEFDAIWIDCMNGDSRETGKLTPDGKPDPSVFSTEYNREGIRVGTAISLLVRKQARDAAPSVRFRHFWGTEKRQELVASLDDAAFGDAYAPARPVAENRFSFRPETVASHYREWPRLTELCAVAPMNGLMEKRGGVLIDIERDALASRMRRYLDALVEWDDLDAALSGITTDAARFDARQARTKLLAAEAFDESRLRRYLVRPFDTRWCYYSGVRPLWNEPRPSLWAQCWEGNAFLLARPAGVANPEGVPVFFTRLLGDNDFQRGHSYYFPIRIKKKEGALGDLFAQAHGEADAVANLSPPARHYLATLGIVDPDADEETAGLIWMHALAFGYAPAYLAENADGIRADWPRIPLPATRALLEASAALGRQVAALLDTESPVDGVTAGTIRPELRVIGNVQREGGGALKPREFQLTAGWGHAGKAGVTMPGRGRAIERACTAEERAALGAGTALLGETTCDIYLNDTAHWANVPANVWGYTIGGYQVMKKWLSYREYALLGRALTGDELREVRDMARRIAALLLLQPALDASYRAVAADTWPWPKA